MTKRRVVLRVILPEDEIKREKLHIFIREIIMAKLNQLKLTADLYYEDVP